MADDIKKVFLSSTIRGLQRFREAVYLAVNGLPDYKCIRMEDFPSRTEPPIHVCLEQLSQCDIYLGIIGHNYGTYIPGTECSYTETEYDEAIQRGMPTLMFMADEDFPVPARDIDDDAKREKQKVFRERLDKLHTRETFATDSDLSLAVTRALQNTGFPPRPFTPAPATSEPLADLSLAVIRALQNTRSPQQPILHGPLSTVLLFNFITNQVGFDTGVSISNTSARPSGGTPKDGACTLYYYGSTTGGGIAPAKQVSEIVIAGKQLVMALSSGGSHGLQGAPGFQGYLIVECDFPNAHGFAMVTNGAIHKARLASGYTAEVIT